ncbi:MAG: NAD(P)/FAD-dependent oxidoreductase [Trueperaceae bacterium]
MAPAQSPTLPGRDDPLTPRVVVVGGGAAGFLAAITCKESTPAAQVTILEGAGQPLAKVRISGGGRCNVTHDQPDPALLVRHYPRGGRALRGPFTKFGPRQTVEWFERRGVTLKTEADGRMFPTTDDSSTIIDCLTGAARAAGVELRTRAPVIAIEHGEADGRAGFRVQLRDGSAVAADRVLLATGGAPAGYRWAQSLGHSVEPPVPSLFTFNVDDPRLEGLAGVSVQHARVRVEGAKQAHEGPILITHWGLSGPAVLRASAWDARILHERGYRAVMTLDWRPDLNEGQVREVLQRAKEADKRKSVLAAGPFGLPQRLWRSLALHAGAVEGTRWADASKAVLAALAIEVHAGRYEVTGKGVFKEEFVTCGGVRLKEVDFATMESRVRPGLYLAGEILDIDGITGGFNFQSAWTTGWLAGQAMAAD